MDIKFEKLIKKIYKPQFFLIFTKMSEEESKKLFRKRKYEKIENDEIINYSKDNHESELQKDSNIHKFNVKKRMLKSRPDGTDILIKQNRRSTLTDLN